eukprot:CAMPEP_0185595288 /NCGR_PEP_ID=MMETSP0434-20130131/77892_1 /TAXON_ID=626734 ORGANISM="Favella taraikaensis, Strain Fe Narragansett Bay" /NCGR_SAMPLE_ID=MMETSP0434 /ASSEMBLY_ACC=CAM_ASM_000379 /LENGTH=124 /DNA_ID=CAMNT_0028223195 /DNA_START=57 /DNA_END=427 /DNA_ORIENTATION=-
MQCVAKCECPREAPLWNAAASKCITAMECDEPAVVEAPPVVDETVYDPAPPVAPAAAPVEPEMEPEAEAEAIKPRFLLVVSNDDCHSEPDPGPCKARLLRWYANPKTGDCERMFYGGCKGNSNR